MYKRLCSVILFVCSVILSFGSAKAGTEPYENFIKGKIKKKDTLAVRDEKFRDPRYRWEDITHKAVRNAITLRILDAKKIGRDFSCEVDLKVFYFSTPEQDSATVIPSVKLHVNYSVKEGVDYKISDIYNFSGAHWIKLEVTRAYSPEFGSDLPDVLQLSAHISIDRQYKFDDQKKIKPFAEIVSATETKNSSTKNNVRSGSAQRFSGSDPPVNTTPTKYLTLTWEAIAGAEEYDIEWTTVDHFSEFEQTVLDMQSGGTTVAEEALNRVFRNNASRVTIAGNQYSIPLVFNNDFLVARMRQVHYTPDGIRLTGAWDHRLGTDAYAVWPLNWHEPDLNWQFSSAFAEEGKKKDVVSYFDGTLRSRQSVTINNTESINVVQETIYDEFGRATASVLPAPTEHGDTGPGYLRYFKNFNLNAAGQPFSFRDLDATSCEIQPGIIAPNSGAGQYYSAQNPFANATHPKYQLFNKFIPQAEGYPFSVTQYTADNTGRIKLQGGVGKAFQPDATVALSHTTKYYYGKPEQWELDQLFGNDVGFAEHYQKNMVVDPNGQISISYLNASGKTIATALAGAAPATMDALSSASSQIKVQKMAVLSPDQFKFDHSSLKLTATTTYLAAMPDHNAKVAYNLKKLLSTYKDGTFQLCNSCYYDVTYRVTDDCGNIIKSAALEPLQIDVTNFNCTETEVNSEFLVDIARIGEYQISFEFVLSRKVLENYTQDFIAKGQASGYLKKASYFVLNYLDQVSFSGCFQDCRTALQDLGGLQDFSAMFKARLTAVDVDVNDLGAELDVLIARKYDSLHTVCQALEAACPITPCDKYEVPMRADVSPGGQYALFDAQFNALEPDINVLKQHFKTPTEGVFNDGQDPNSTAYKSSLVTLEDGSVRSPYDPDFTLAMLVRYWKPEWSLLFLPYHPEICKLTFCYSNEDNFRWDERVKLIGKASDINRIPGAGTWSSTSGHPTWLLDIDPFFETGASGAGQAQSMRNDLLNFSKNFLGVNTSYSGGYTFNIKDISAMGDLLLYGSQDTQSQDASYWNNFQVSADCRIPDREWEMYRSYYFQLKEKYVALAREGVCPSCTIGGGGAPSSCGSVADYIIKPDVRNAIVCESGKIPVIVQYTKGIPANNVIVTIADQQGNSWPVTYNSGQAYAFVCVPDDINIGNIKVTRIDCNYCPDSAFLTHAVHYDQDNTYLINDYPDRYKVTVISGYSVNQQPPAPTDCISPINGNNTADLLGYYECFAMKFKDNSTPDFYSHVWVYTCQFDYPNTGGGGGEDPGPGGEQNMRTAVQANTAGKSTSKQNDLRAKELVTSLKKGDELTVDPKTKAIYLISPLSKADTIFSRSQLAVKGKVVLVMGKKTRKGFLPYRFFREYDIQPNKFIHKRKRNVWVARLRPQLHSRIDSLKLKDTEGERTITIQGDESNAVNMAARQQGAADTSVMEEMVSSSILLNTSSATCALYANKISRFETNASSTIASGSTSDYNNLLGQTEAERTQYAEDACKGNVENALWALEAGLRAKYTDEALYQQKRTALYNAFLAIAMAGRDAQHPHGTSTLASAVPGGYASFGDAIKAILDIDPFTPLLNPWIIDAPPPHNVVQQVTLPLVSHTSASICSELSALRSTYPSSTELAAFLKITVNELDVLEASCINPTCGYLTREDVRLPVRLAPVTPGRINSITKQQYNDAVDRLLTIDMPGLNEGSPNYYRIFTTYLNFKFGFVLSYEDLQRFATSTENDLYNDPIDMNVPVDPYALAKEQIGRAAIEALADYETYIKTYRDRFAANYIDACSKSQARADLTAHQQQYHFTLYYYDQADNLIRTIPPEGVELLSDADQQKAGQYRNVDGNSCIDYNGPTGNSVKELALASLKDALDRPGNSAIEMWTYTETPGALNNVVMVDLYKHYLFQTTINGNNLGVDIYPLTPDGSAIKFSPATRHFRATLPANMLPLGSWQHIVIQGSALGTSADLPQIYLNGIALTVIASAEGIGGSWSVTATPSGIVYPETMGTLKHLRFYDRTLPTSEIAANAANVCLSPMNEVVLWYRFNTPLPGGPTTVGGGTNELAASSPIFPAHRMASSYVYGSLGSLLEQTSPDKGKEQFWYDLKGRLAASQNALAANQAPTYHNYRYVKYDDLGRATETGYKTQTIDLGAPAYLIDDKSTALYSTGYNYELTRTYYDAAQGYLAGMITGLPQNNLRKRVAAMVTSKPHGSTDTLLSAVYYNYDLSGNVKDMYRQIPDLGVKRINYEYDLISGKVNMVAYQPAQNDQFYYQYKYDAENRLTEAWSSPVANMVSYGLGSTLDVNYRKLDASYYYYLHGSLARTELGDQYGKIQGIDHAYTLQGWLKGVNAPTLEPSKDMGQDGYTQHPNIYKDVMGYTLNYYHDDYKPIGSGAATSFGLNYQAQPADITGQDLFNGNISSTTVALDKFNSAQPVGYTYHYDQLNRIKKMRQHGLDNSTTVWNGASMTNAYSEDVSYDANGNILTFQRNGASVPIDQMTYSYDRNTAGQLINNKLTQVRDDIPDPGKYYLENYHFDVLGDLILEGNTGYEWDQQDNRKLDHVYWLDGDQWKNGYYFYDPMANRERKLFPGVDTYYVRDAQGNTLAVYEKRNQQITWREQDLYGSSRIGSWKPELNLSTGGNTASTIWQSAGNKQYELTNHLGNVLATVSDKTNGTTADVLTMNDYYPFGMLQEGRNYSQNSTYRYGFNGKENDNDVGKGTGNQQDYGMRIYNPRLGRFLSVDPITAQYPELTPYQFASNTPIQAIDLDGLEAAKTEASGRNIVARDGGLTRQVPIHTPKLAPTDAEKLKAEMQKLMADPMVGYRSDGRGLSYPIRQSEFAALEQQHRNYLGDVTSSSPAAAIGYAIGGEKWMNVGRVVGGVTMASSSVKMPAFFGPKVEIESELVPEWNGQQISPNEINFSQRTVSGNVNSYVSDMKAGNWDWNKSGAIRVMSVNGQLVSYDNRRLMAAQQAGINAIPYTLVNPNEMMPGSKKTWQQAFNLRFNDIRNVAAGGAVPANGLKSQPKVTQ